MTPRTTCFSISNYKLPDYKSNDTPSAGIRRGVNDLRYGVIPLLVCFSLAAWSAQLRQVALLDIPGNPGFDHVVFARGMLVMAHDAGDTLDIFDPTKRRIIAQVPGMTGPHGLAVDAHLDLVYVANSGGKNIAVVSSKDWKVVRTIVVPFAPYDLELLPEGKRLLLADWQQQSITALDLADGDKANTLDLNGSPAGLAFDSATQTVFASLQDTAEIVAIDGRSLHVVKRFKLAASQPTGIAWDAAGHRLYIAVRHAVLTLDAESGTELGRVEAPAGADSLWLDASAGVLYLASAGGFLDIYRTGDAKLISLEEIHTDVRGHSVAFDPEHKLLYLPGGREGRAKLLILKQLGPPNQEQVATK
jgi:DNA-binding beta-propeller fold protein YncE